MRTITYFLILFVIFIKIIAVAKKNPDSKSNEIEKDLNGKISTIHGAKGLLETDNDLENLMKKNNNPIKEKK